MKKEFRVLKNYEFSSIIQNRQFVKSSSFVCYFQKRKLDHARVGISVGKKLGNAVCRNKVKRQLRSIVDDIFTFEEGYDLIIIVRPAYANKSFEENKNEMKENQNRINKRFLDSAANDTRQELPYTTKWPDNECKYNNHRNNSFFHCSLPP